MLALPNPPHILPLRLEKVLVEFPADRPFFASDITSLNQKNARYLVSLRNRGMIECLGYKNQHEKVKRWKLTPAGSELADKIRARGKT